MYKLAVVKGPDRGNVFNIDEFPAGIGRDSRNQIALRDALVSRFQAQVEMRGDRVVLRDNGSTNGTEVNGFKIELHNLKAGDMMQMGNSVIVFYRQNQDEDDSQGSSEVKFDPGQTLAGVRVDVLGASRAEELFGQSHMVRFHPDELLRSHLALSTLYGADEVFELATDRGELLNRLAELVLKAFKPLRVAILIRDDATGELRPRVVSPPDEKGSLDRFVSKTVNSAVLESREAFLVEDVLEEQDLRKSISLRVDDVRSVMAVPLKSKEEVLGILQVFGARTASPFTEDDLRLLVALGSKAGSVLESARLYRDLHDLFLSTTQALIDALEAKDPYTRGHSDRVASYSVCIGRELKLNETDLKDLYHAAVLHDLGKIGMPDQILHSTDKLTDEEFERVKEHPVLGARLLGNIPLLKASLPGVRSHHEALNGSGYPDGLSGDEIPMIARIISVADIFDALTSDRTYRKALSPEEALAELESIKGSKLDPVVVDAFARSIAERTGSLVQSSFQE